MDRRTKTVGPDATLSGGLVAAATLFLVNYLLKYIQCRFPLFGKVVEGDTIMLVYEEKMIESNMKKAKITEDKLMEAVPEHGVSSIEEVILPYNLLFKKTTNEDFSQ